ncbi:MAG: hypothetical protein MR332_05995 [Fusicatenibacter sp.]|nr:hypothetical protein [Fusicatenibacter sp.]
MTSNQKQVRNQSIYFLGDLGILEKYNAYGRINGTEGQYIELEDGTFENVREYAEDRENISGRTSTEPLEQPSIYTMDEMKDQIN